MEARKWLDSLREWLITAAVVIFVLFGWSNKRRVEYREVVKNDTIYVRDTIRIETPIHIREVVVRYDTVYLCSIDTIDKKDSIEVVMPITQKVYEDSLYKAVVRGYNPELVSLDIYRQQTTVYRQQTRKPKVVVSAGVYGGFGVKGADYGVGISVGVPIWWW